MEPPKNPELTSGNATIGFALIAGLIIAVVGGLVAVPLCVMSGLAINPLFTASAACEELPQPGYPTGADAALVDQSLITDTPCGPPCWQGITPGVTTYQEALAIIKASPLVKPGSVDAPGSATIRWSSALTPPPAYGDIKFKQGIVWTITYDLEYLLTLADLIDALGEPEYVGLDPYRYPDAPAPPCDTATLVWLSRGVEVLLQDIDERQIAAGTSPINEAGVIRQAYYFASVNSLSDFVCTGTGHLRYEEAYQPWNGFEQVRLPDRQ